MSRDELNLLLYLEARAVDDQGSIDMIHINDNDIKIIKTWNKNGFIQYGRIVFKDAKRLSRNGHRITHWCRLSPTAWNLAHQERLDRAERMWKKRSWLTTDEKKEKQMSEKEWQDRESEATTACKPMTLASEMKKMKLTMEGK